MACKTYESVSERYACAVDTEKILTHLLLFSFELLIYAVNNNNYCYYFAALREQARI